MPLPKVVAPTFEVNLLSTGKPVKYRPFLVKEEKALLIALESGSEKDIISTVKNVIKACVQSRIKVDSLPSFDLEYLFLNIRGKSVGETVELLVTCSDDEEVKVPLIINMSDIGLDVPDGHTDTIQLEGGVSIKMKYPSMDEFLKTNFSVTDESDANLVDEAFKGVAKCIDTIYTEEEAWSASDCTQAELIKFIEQLSSGQFAKIENFFSTMPKLRYEGEVTNPNTKVKTDVVVEGMANFFG
jgi:hypothetical protein|tara:strand:- start:962 stop:1687 length:726 start_codon:yes stop_codon:yes gene_type:complete